VSVTAAQQSAQLPDIKEVRPKYRDIHSQVLQDVLTRLDRAFQAFFRRVKNGEAPGYPRFQGTNRYNSFTFKQFGNGTTLDNGFLACPRSGDWPCVGRARWRAHPRPSPSVGKRMGGMSASPVQMCQYTPCHLQDRRLA
jgi:hypothetical protein